MAEHEILIYDEIGEWGITAKDVAEQLSGLHGSDHVTVRINSPGGDVFDGLAIFNRLLSSSAAVDVIIDGWAASAASVVAMAGDTISMAANAFIFVHAPSNNYTSIKSPLLIHNPGKTVDLRF